MLPTRLLTAWGDSETIGYHAANFAKAEVILYGGVENANTDPILELTNDPDVPFFDVTAVREVTRGFVFRFVCFLYFRRSAHRTPGRASPTVIL